MSKISDQFQGLPMESLIGGPLKAACDAQVLLAKASADFIRDVGLQNVSDKGKPEVLNARTVDFSFKKPVQAADGSTSMTEVDLKVPLLAILNTPSLMVKEVDIQFTMEVKETVTDHSSTDKEGSFDAEAKVGWGRSHLM